MSEGKKNVQESQDENAGTVENMKDAETSGKNQGESTAYVGPSIPGVITRNTVFTNGLPKALEEKIMQYPFLRALVVPITELNLAIREIGNPGSAMSVVYEKAKKILK